MRQLAVDLGTSRTVAVLVQDGSASHILEIDGGSAMPTGVYAEEDGRLLAGREAQRRAHHDPGRYEPHPTLRIRETNLLLGERVVPVVDAVAAVLRRVAEDGHRALGGPLDELLLTVPDYWAPVEHQALRQAVAMTPWADTKVRLIPGALAAGAHCAVQSGVPLGRPFAVYDLGAGGVSCGVVSAEAGGMVSLAAGGLPTVGGVEADLLVLRHVGTRVSGRDPGAWNALLHPSEVSSRRRALSVLEHVRAAREQLSTVGVVTLELPRPFGEVQLTRDELSTLLRPQLERSVAALADTVQRANLPPGAFAGVFLLGGLAHTPLAAELVGVRFGVLGTAYDAAVALGAPLAERHGSVVAPSPPPAWAPVPGPTAAMLPGDGWQQQHSYGKQPKKKSGAAMPVAFATAAVLFLLVAGRVVARIVSIASDSPRAAAVTRAPSSAAPSSSAPPTTTTSAVASLPVVSGWQTVASPDRGAAYDVPAGWKAFSQGTIGGFETKTGDRVVGKGYASFASDFCTQYSSKGASALTGSKEADPAAGARDVATRWAKVAFTDDNTGVTPPLQTGAPQVVTTLTGKAGSLVEVTAPLTKEKDCAAPAGSVYAFAMPSTDKGTFVLVVYAARGVPDELSAAVVRQIASSVRA
ncbi:MAG: Hsp70 family protein, partial [Mycobacteriaceae bacterium]